MSDKYTRFSNAKFEDFRKMATDKSLSIHEKIGFPDEYREGFEQAIFEDILEKLPSLKGTGKTVLDIGPGCAGLPHLIVNYCARHQHDLWLIDSEEMLTHLPEGPGIHKVAACYPQCETLLKRLAGKVDAVICYSVFHYIFVESSTWSFLDKTLSLLAPGGRFLLADIPNISKRKRFFSSQSGIEYHKRFTGKNMPPEKPENFQAEENHIDDAVMFGMMMRARQVGFDAYILPQHATLPMANRREDLLFICP